MANEDAKERIEVLYLGHERLRGADGKLHGKSYGPWRSTSHSRKAKSAKRPLTHSVEDTIDQEQCLEGFDGVISQKGSVRKEIASRPSRDTSSTLLRKIMGWRRNEGQGVRYMPSRTTKPTASCTTGRTTPSRCPMMTTMRRRTSWSSGRSYPPRRHCEGWPLLDRWRRSTSLKRRSGTSTTSRRPTMRVRCCPSRSTSLGKRAKSWSGRGGSSAEPPSRADAAHAAADAVRCYRRRRRRPIPRRRATPGHLDDEVGESNWWAADIRKRPF